MTNETRKFYDGGCIMNRDELRYAFLAKHGWDDAEILPLTPDASFRRYARLRRADDAKTMLMDAPPPHENAAAFVAVTKHLSKLGVRVPTIFAADEAHGFLLLEDLGDETFTRLLAEKKHNETTLYQNAVDLLSRINQHADATAINLPIYDYERAIAEANLLLDWYIPARTQRPVTATARQDFAQVWAEIFRSLPPLPPTLVLRDFHIDNLMLVGKECAVLDYQDAVIGSPAYDLVSLLEDARRDISPALTKEMLTRFAAKNPTINPADLHQHFIVWGAQRHCKVAGIFIRLWLRDKKPTYKKHLPRVLKLLTKNLNEPTLSPLKKWLNSNLKNLNTNNFSKDTKQLLQHCGGE